MPRSAAPLVGRAGELATLADAVVGARAGRAAAVVLGGDAGVGKTRMLAELVSVASDGGFVCLIGHCVDLGDTPPPYLPFTEAFARFAADHANLAEELLAGFPSLARLIPGRPGSGSRAPDDRLDRGELFDAVLGGLAWLGTERPVLLLVEDIHWADQATRDLLGYLFARLQTELVAAVASYRSDDLHRRHPLRAPLAEWLRLPSVTRVHLDPLPADDVGALVRAINPTPIAEADLDGIVSRADGNAFFAEELLAATLACSDAQQLPWQLADLLLVRLDRLSDDARQVVRVAAVAGRRVAHTTLEAVMQLPVPRLDDALRAAVDAHVLELTSSGRGYTFRHALLAEAVYDDLLPGERVRLHASYAAVLAASENPRPAELARHALASHDLPTALTASIAAGDEAMALAAPQEAMQHYEAALELLIQLPAQAPDRARLTLAAVEAATAAGHTLRGTRLARRALDELPADAPPLDRAILLFASAKVSLGGEVDEDAVAHISEALRLVPATPPTALRAEVLAVHARIAFAMGNEVEAVRAAQEAVELGDRVGSRVAVADARTSLAVLERRTGDPDEAARQLEAVVAAAVSSGDAGAELRSRYSLASLRHEQCDLSAASVAFVETARRAGEIGRPWEAYGVLSRAMAATVQYQQGDWDAALATLDTSRERPTAVADAMFRSTKLAVQAGRGELDAITVVDELRPFWSREGRIPLYTVFGALEIYEQQADVAAALTLVDQVVAHIGQLWLDPWFLARVQFSAQGLGVLCAAAIIAPQAQHAALAAKGEQLLDDGRSSAERGLPQGRLMGREGEAWVAKLEAEMARLRWLTGVDPPSADELVSAWWRTVELFSYGNVVHTVRARARLAEALRTTGRIADASEQAELARAAAEAMGAKPVLAQLRAVGAPRRSADAGRGGGLIALTDRERDVLEQLVDARTNRQIAGKLFISEKTVSVHVSNILAKLGVRSRAEAAALARRQ